MADTPAHPPIISLKNFDERKDEIREQIMNAAKTIGRIQHSAALPGLGQCPGKLPQVSEAELARRLSKIYCPICRFLLHQGLHRLARSRGPCLASQPLVRPSSPGLVPVRSTFQMLVQCWVRDSPNSLRAGTLRSPLRRRPSCRSSTGPRSSCKDTI